MSDNRVCLGAIAGAFGVQGEVRIKSFCAIASDIAEYGPLQTEDGAQAFTITLTRPVKEGYSARLSGITTKEAADALRGVRLYVDRARLPEPDENEFYHADLIGLTVKDTGGSIIGTVKTVMEQGAGDLLEVQRAGADTALIPFTLEIVPTVDIAAGIIIIDPPEGLL